jgi:Fic family protein
VGRKQCAQQQLTDCNDLGDRRFGIDSFITRFATGYRLERLSQIDRVIAVAAAHHRLVWIHPFYDGNGRVARLFSHAIFREIGIGTSLWSISRGLARSRAQYRDVLANADLPRWNDLDGRGNLTAKGLQAFCEFFLSTCIDQVQFMRSCLDPSQLLARIEVYVGEEVVAKRLLPGSDRVVAAVFRSGELERGQAAASSGYQDRQGRKVLQRLLENGLLISATPKGAVRVGFPSTLLVRVASPYGESIFSAIIFRVKDRLLLSVRLLLKLKSNPFGSSLVGMLITG